MRNSSNTILPYRETLPESFSESKIYEYNDIQEYLNPSSRKPVQWFVKKRLDFVLAVVGIICIAPLALIICILVKLESGGPLIYKQKRRGLYNKDFYMYKFRSMVIDAHQQRGALLEQNQSNQIMFKMKRDPRVTRVGAFLRKYSLDELPQLFNVLKGDMSLVGPRPPLPEEVDKYENWHHVRFSLRPGLTGKWQTSGRSKIKCFNEVVKLDYSYIRDWNLIQDFKILLKTVPVVLFGKE